MKLSLLLAICILAFSLANAQQLSIPEIVKLRYQKFEQMDSTLKQKGYSVVEDTKDPEWRLVMYRSIVSEDGKPVMRNVMISQVFNPRILEIDYRIWVKKEIDELKDWLVKNGYKKGQTWTRGDEVSTSYTKAGKIIAIQQITQSNGILAYQVHINNKDHK